MSEAKIYGKSIFSLAREEGLEDELFSELGYISELFREYPDYASILSSPRLGREELIKMLDEDFSGRVGLYTLNFLKLLAQNRIIRRFSECFDIYRDLYNDYKRVKLVQVTSARALNENIKDKLEKKLEEKLGKKIILEQRIDKECIGGIIIEADGRRIDASIKTKLSQLEIALTS